MLPSNQIIPLFFGVFLFLFADFISPQQLALSKIKNDSLSIGAANSELSFYQKFDNSDKIIIDADLDGTDEIFVIDVTIKNEINFYTLFLFSSDEKNILLDTLYSSIVEPTFSYSEDSSFVIIRTGFYDVDSLIEISDSEFLFSPINFWKFENDKLININEDCYELFLAENEFISDIVEEYFLREIKNCNSTKRVLSLIASLYINYMNAEEKILAKEIINRYYFCDDLDNFLLFLNKIL